MRKANGIVSDSPTVATVGVVSRIARAHTGRTARGSRTRGRGRERRRVSVRLRGSKAPSCYSRANQTGLVVWLSLLPTLRQVAMIACHEQPLAGCGGRRTKRLDRASVRTGTQGNTGGGFALPARSCTLCGAGRRTPEETGTRGPEAREGREGWREHMTQGIARDLPSNTSPA